MVELPLTATHAGSLEDSFLRMEVDVGDTLQILHKCQRWDKAKWGKVDSINQEGGGGG